MALLISSIDHVAGVVTLSDGSRWQVGPGDAGTIVPWRPGHPVTLAGPGLTRDVRNEGDGSAALVCPVASARGTRS
jgi:hypothetical protein